MNWIALNCDFMVNNCLFYDDKLTFMHLAEAFIQKNLQSIQAIHFLSVYINDKIS